MTLEILEIKSFFERKHYEDSGVTKNMSFDSDFAININIKSEMPKKVSVLSKLHLEEFYV